MATAQALHSLLLLPFSPSGELSASLQLRQHLFRCGDPRPSRVAPVRACHVSPPARPTGHAGRYESNNDRRDGRGRADVRGVAESRGGDAARPSSSGAKGALDG
eukprot:365075-Chlamydomonas_euryale.AAC.10